MAEEEAPEAEQAEEIPPLNPDDVFVSAATGLTGVLDSHNVLARQVLQLLKALETLKGRFDCSEELREQAEAASNEEKQRNKEAQEEVQNQVNGRLESLEAQMEQQGKSLATVEEKMTDLQENTETKMQALQHSIDEISNHQAELKSRVLPSWEAELSKQIKTLGQDIVTFQESAEGRMAQVEVASKELKEECLQVEQRLTPLLQTAKQRIDAQEEELKLVAGDMAERNSESQKSLETLSAELKEQLVASVESLEAFAVKQDEVVMSAFKESFNSRLGNMESALKWSDYERLIFSERTSKELVELREQLKAVELQTEKQSGEVLELRKDTCPDIQNIKGDFAGLKEITSKLEEALNGCQARAAQIDHNAREATAELGSRHDELKQRLVAEIERLEPIPQVEAKQVLSAIRNDEGERLKRLEADFQHERGERLELAQRLEKEERERQENVENCQRVAEKRSSDVELVSQAQFESVRQALDELVVEFQGYVKSESSRVTDVTRLEALVRALEVRVWPWRCASKDRSRSPSPSPHHGSGWETGDDNAWAGAPRSVANSGATGADWQDWLKMEKPATARVHPGRPGAMRPVGPVGPALKAARSRAATQEPN